MARTNDNLGVTNLNPERHTVESQMISPWQIDLPLRGGGAMASTARWCYILYVAQHEYSVTTYYIDVVARDDRVV